jgi:hypothetical protein
MGFRSIGAVVEMGILSTLKRLLMESSLQYTLGGTITCSRAITSLMEFPLAHASIVSEKCMRFGCRFSCVCVLGAGCWARGAGACAHGDCRGLHKMHRGTT